MNIDSKAKVKYREIPGCPGYRAGNDGSIWSRAVRGRPRLLSGALMEAPGWRELRGHSRKGDQRRFFGLHLPGGKVYWAFASALVLMAFVGSRPPGAQCGHRDGDSCNSRLENVFWKTFGPKEKKGHPCGEKHHNAKLTQSDVAEIRRRVSQGERQVDLANEKKVSKSTVSDIIHGRKWKIQ